MVPLGDKRNVRSHYRFVCWCEREQPSGGGYSLCVWYVLLKLERSVRSKFLFLKIPRYLKVPSARELD